MSQSTIRILRRGQHLSYLATLVPWGRAGATPLESVCRDIYCRWQDPESLGKALAGRLVGPIRVLRASLWARASAQGQILGPMWISAMGLLK